MDVILDLAVRFVIGGLVVCAFAIVGDIVKPKSFAGLFGAAPSVALATLSLAFAIHGAKYAASDGRSMIIGAVGLVLYSVLVGWLLVWRRSRPILTAVSSWALWVGTAFGLWAVFLR